MCIEVNSDTFEQML